MTRIFLTVTLAGAALVGTARAQVGPPALGYLPDSGSLRAMSGIPASGSIGPVLGSGQTFNQVVASPSGAFALAAVADGTVAVVTVASDGVTLNTSIVAGATAGTLQLSPNGSSALISNGGQLQVITGLPGSPVAQPTVDATYLGAVSALAISDDGQWVAGVFGGAVSALGSGGQAIPLPAPSGVTALSFFHGTDDLVATTANQVVEISNIAGTPTSTTLFGSANAPVPAESPVSIALTGDNTQIVLVEPDGGIGQINLTTGAVTSANCGCTPQGLSGLGGSVFRLSNLAGGSVKVYDADSGSVLFVPLAPAGTQGGQQ
jgi:hypothetical protein